jgi:hypothetical protein
MVERGNFGGMGELRGGRIENVKPVFQEMGMVSCLHHVER